MNIRNIFLSLAIIAVIAFVAPSYAIGLESSNVDDTELMTVPSVAMQSGNVQADFDEFPNLHPMVVHFPIVLLLFAAILQLIQLFVMKHTMDWVILLIVGSGFIGAYVAGTLVHPDTEGLTEMAKKVLEEHDKYASWTVWSSAVAAVMKLVSLFWFKLRRGFEIAVLLVMAFSAYSVSQAGHYGSQLVYIEGVGPQGKYLGSETEEGQKESSEHSH